ncbi:major capsid protein, partial [Nocardia aurantiaca]
MDFSLKTLLRRRQVHDLTHERKFSCNMADLIPIMAEDVLPGDTFSNTTEMLVRLVPLLAPVMHRVNIYTHFFFVPNWIIWSFSRYYAGQNANDEAGENHKGWEEFITGYNRAGAYKPGDNGIDIHVPLREPIWRITPQESWTGSLADYLIGCPEITMTQGDRYHHVSALPLRAYAEIWNEWFRDEDLQDPVPVSHTSNTSNSAIVADGLDVQTSRVLLRRGWEKDYFTSCRPWMQKGAPVKIPLTGNAPVKWQNAGSTSFARVRDGNGNLVYSPYLLECDTYGRLNTAFGAMELTPQTGDPTHPIGFQDTLSNIKIKDAGTDVSLGGAIKPGLQTNSDIASLDPNGTLYADLSAVTASTINDLRMAFQLQKFLERAARAGGRYIETILAHFGVHTPDARLRRPEYLGGGKSPIVFSEVLQTSATGSASDDTPLGEIGGHAFAAMKAHTFKKTFAEHGWVIGLLSILPRTAYQQGIARRFTRNSRLDYYWPEFAHLGEQ